MRWCFSDKSVKVTINTPLKCGTMENTVSIYPNPVTQIIYAEGCEEFKLMELFTLEGKLVEHSVIISPKVKWNLMWKELQMEFI